MLQHVTVYTVVSVGLTGMHKTGGSGEDNSKKRKEKTTPFAVSLMRSQVLYRAAQVERQHLFCMCLAHHETESVKIRIIIVFIIIHTLICASTASLFHVWLFLSHV